MIPSEHRPWPSPNRAWNVAMTWYDLAFLHWPVDAELLQAHVPRRLAIDTFDGQAWLGVVPFAMSGVRPRCVPSLPWVSKFLELNVRTYVVGNNKPGVWFFSLDAANPVAVRVAKRAFHLNYFDARMSLTDDDGWFHYRSRRTHRGQPPLSLDARYRPVGDVFAAQPGSLEHWLTERYCLFAADRFGQTYCGEVNHRQWPLQNAEVQIHDNRMAEPLGLELPNTVPLAHFSRRLETVAWTLRRLDA